MDTIERTVAAVSRRELGGIHRVLDQTEFWVPNEKPAIRVADMSHRYKVNTRNFLIRRAESVAARVAQNYMMLEAYYFDEIQGTMSLLNPKTYDGHLARVKAVGAEQWMIETPLCRELLYQSRASNFDGSID